MPLKQIKSYCRKCGKETNHDILHEDIESSREDYSYDLKHQIVMCKGCDSKSFRKEFIDIEAAYPIDHEEWDVPTTITVYPKSIEGHREIESIGEVPDIVRKIYSEILLALKEEAKVLAGLGLRSAVEAVCNDRNISGKNLEVRISRLSTAGYISRNDAERLQGIRFMGNDAAHDIKSPKDESLKVALQIVEHLIASVYILEKRANGSLEIAISRYEHFQNILDEKLIGISAGEEAPLAKWFGKDIRRVKESLATLEAELVTRIGDGRYLKLIVGKVDHYQSSPVKLQHFVVK